MDKNLNKVNTVNCPRCGAAIDSLNAFCFEQNKYRVSLTDSYHGTRAVTLDWSTSEAIELSATKTDFTCPECEEIIFTERSGDSNPQVVLDFLKGVRMTWVQDVGKRAMVLEHFNKRTKVPGAYYAEGFPRAKGDIGIYFVDPTSTEKGMDPVET